MQFLIVVIAAWLGREQETFIAYLKAENRLLKATPFRRQNRTVSRVTKLLESAQAPCTWA
jgi:hypothetical protein